MRLSPAALVERARAAEAAGFGGIAGMDHLTPPMASDQPMFSAMTTSTWLAAHTDRLTVGSLVLCDGFRHPAVLAQEAVTIDHLSGGRFELGIGWGSVREELETFGVTSIAPGPRVRRLAESLDIIKGLWTGEPFDYAGEHFHLSAARQNPVPTRRIPIVIGGVGPKTLRLVAEHADWWNLHVGVLDKVEELRPQVGSARVSIQQMVAFVPTDGDRAEVTALAQRRFGPMGVVVGTGPELADHFHALGARGVERVYTWFTDFAAVSTLEGFGSSVIAELG